MTTEVGPVQAPIFMLPAEILSTVFKNLNISDLCAARRACHAFYRVASDDVIWKQIATQYQLTIPQENNRRVIEIVSEKAKGSQAAFHTCINAATNVTDETIRSALNTFSAFITEIQIEIAGDRTCQLTGASLQEMATRCPNLKSFSLVVTNAPEAVTLADQDFDQFTKKCSKLTNIKLRGCLLLTSVGLQALATNCVNLRQVSIASNGLSDQFVETLVKRHRLLDTLELEGAPNAVTDQSLKAISTYCYNLRTFQMMLFVQPFSKERVKKLIDSFAMKSVKSFTLKGCDKVSDKMIELLSKLPLLRSLYLGGCGQVTKKSIKSLAGNSPMLEKLILHNCKDADKLNHEFDKLKANKFQQISYKNFTT